MSYGWYWTTDNKVHDCEVLEVNGALAHIRDEETGESDWVNAQDVQPVAIDEWHETNGQLGIGA